VGDSGYMSMGGRSLIFGVDIGPYWASWFGCIVGVSWEGCKVAVMHLLGLPFYGFPLVSPPPIL
jgi:hypothetical protein